MVIDDASPDNTAEVAMRYSEVHYHWQENRGIAEARNAGFRFSRGEYVIFLDADDRLTPNAVESHLRCLAEHPEAGFVVGDIDQISADGSYIYSPRWPLLKRNFYEELLKVNHVANTIAVMFRRAVVESIGGFEKKFTPAEDYRILLRAARSFPSAHHRSVVAQYRRHQSNTSRKGVVMLRAMRKVMEMERLFLRGNAQLKAAHQKGARYWRDHFGAATIKEIFRHLVRGEVLQAGEATAALLWHVRGRLFLFPWKYRRHVLNNIRSRICMPMRTNIPPAGASNRRAANGPASN